MDRKMGSRFQRHGSTFVGAIMMSNRTTKQECLQRKLFGMPSSLAWHVTQIKAGMLLFLFEHEERKLYGVFEAASDGAMNIIPDAFLSSGNSFPAQVHFKRIWMCKPLSEDEFYHAIKDNYFAQKKFKFGLSYGQVYKLIQLFSLKRINIGNYERAVTTNEIIEEFERDGGNNVKVFGGGGSNKSFSDEHSPDDNTGSQSEHQLYQGAPEAGEAYPPSYLGYQCKPSNDLSSSGNLSKCLKYGYHARGKYYSLSPQKAFACVGSSDDTKPNQISAQSHASNIDTYPLHLCSPNLTGSSIPAGDTYNVSFLPTVSSEHHFSFNDYQYKSHAESYDPAYPMISYTREMPEAKGTNYFELAHTSDFHGHPEASTRKRDFERQRCGVLGPLPDFVPLADIDCVDMNVIPSYLDSPSESMQDGLQGMQPCLATYSEPGYPTVDSRLRSDTEQRRVSVFARLSKTRKACQVPKCRGAFHKRGSLKTQTKFSQDHPASTFSRRGGQLIEKKKTPKQLSINKDDAKKVKNKILLEAKMTTSPGELERVDDTVDEDGIAEEAIVEQGSELLLLSSKRKSGRLSLSGENQMIVDADSGMDEDTSQEYRRRKLLRTSASQEECGNREGLIPENVEVNTMTENNAMNNSELLLLSSKCESGRLSLSGENQMNVDADSGMDKDTSHGCSRSKLIRTSANLEECGNREGLIPEIVEVNTMTENNAMNSGELLLSRSKSESGRPSLSGENQMNVDAGSGMDEDSSQEHMRRKLLRTSASQEECGNTKGLISEIIEVNTMIDNNAMNIKTCEVTRPNNFDTDNKNGSASEASLGDVISDKREVNTRSLNTHRKEVSNKNLRWFLQKSINILPKESNVDQVNGETKDASQVVDDASLLPPNSKH